MGTRTRDAIEVGLGLTKLGNCTCADPLIICGRRIWASAYGAYDRNNEGCANFQAYKEGLPQSCGNCKFWEAREGIDAYE